VNKTAASATQFAKSFCFMLVHIQLQLPATQAQIKISFIAYLTSWHNIILGYKLKTD